jgi:cytochrome c556
MWKKFLKIKTAIIIMLISLLCSFAVSAADNKERSIDFNDSWKFIQSDGKVRSRMKFLGSLLGVKDDQAGTSNVQ